MNDSDQHKVEVYRLLSDNPLVDLLPVSREGDLWWTVGSDYIGLSFNEIAGLDDWKSVLLLVRSCVAALKAYKEADAEIYKTV